MVSFIEYARCATYSRKLSETSCVANAAGCKQIWEILTLDLKEWGAEYILHMMDGFTQCSVSTLLKRKLSKLVVEQILLQWVAVFNIPGRIWSDLGGEFTSVEIKEMSEQLGCSLGTGVGYSAWMNSLN